MTCRKVGVVNRSLLFYHITYCLYSVVMISAGCALIHGIATVIGQEDISLVIDMGCKEKLKHVLKRPEEIWYRPLRC